MSNRKYTDAQLRFLEHEWKRRELASLTKAFNRKFRLRKSQSKIRSVLSEHRFKSGRPRGGGGKNRLYTDVMLRWLQRNWPKPAMSLPTITAAFNRRFRKRIKVSQVKAAIHNHGIRCGGTAVHRPTGYSRIFTRIQQRDIARLYQKYAVTEVTRRLNEKHGTAFKVQQVDTYIANHKIQSGRTGCFEKGIVPWNKGTKGVVKPNSGNFKKGQVPATAKPMGHERICTKDGYVLVKIAEKNPHTPAPTRFKAKHIVVWEQAHGRTVPKGFCVRFLDGDKRNFAIENLVLMSRGANAVLNKKYKLDQVPAHLKPTMILVASVEAAAGGRRKKAERLAA